MSVSYTMKEAKKMKDLRKKFRVGDKVAQSHLIKVYADIKKPYKTHFEGCVIEVEKDKMKIAWRGGVHKYITNAWSSDIPGGEYPHIKSGPIRKIGRCPRKETKKGIDYWEREKEASP